ncbi:ABC transporter permease [Sulfitobacter sp. M22]|uniref:ABC transporter permease n=1 Tax=Sulfitobacter sp. M22 TaxID=2675332 RepID=UPI001F8524DD|nr:ABC transporter permease [Sulfitobacter sp. M22]MCF7728174.1 ABC transporter permease subunit [Sulfitobacter sp. M22]
MLHLITTRLLGAIPVLLLVTMAIFGLLRLAPGDAAELLLPDDATEEQVAETREDWGLDRPVWVQYGQFLSNLARFDLGESYRYRAPVFELIGERLPATLELSFYALLLAIVIAVPLGMLAALNKGKVIDAIVSVLSISGVSAPSFWVGILLVLFFSGYMNLFPSSGRLPYGVSVPTVTGFVTIDALLAGSFETCFQALRYLALPALTLTLAMIGIISRITRAAVIDAGQEEHVFTAVAKGMKRRSIVRRHLMPNAAIPIVTIIGLELGALISGSIIVEVVFSWPGIGTLLFQSISVRDMPLTTGVVASYTILFIALNLLIDIFYVLIDPRLRNNKA